MNYDKYKVDIEKYPYPDKAEYKKKLLTELNSEHLTKAEYDTRYNKLYEPLNAWYKEQAEIYYSQENELRDLFWEDARQELGYDKYLTKNGVRILEEKAWADGHAHGYQEVFYHLVELDTFLINIKNELNAIR